MLSRKDLTWSAICIAAVCLQAVKQAAIRGDFTPKPSPPVPTLDTTLKLR